MFMRQRLDICKGQSSISIHNSAKKKAAQHFPLYKAITLLIHKANAPGTDSEGLMGKGLNNLKIPSETGVFVFPTTGTKKSWPKPQKTTRDYTRLQYFTAGTGTIHSGKKQTLS